MGAIRNFEQSAWKGGRKARKARANLEVDAAGVAHERLAQSDTALLAPDDAALQHQPVLVDLSHIYKSSRLGRNDG